VEQAKSAEAQEAKIALETKNPEILEAYLQKNSASPQRSELLRAMSSLLRSEHDEWTIFGWALPKNLPAYLKINSIEQFGDSVAAEMEWVFDPSSTDHPPENSYQISREVFSCNEQIVRIAENKILTSRTMYSGITNGRTRISLKRWSTRRLYRRAPCFTLSAIYFVMKN